MNVYRTAFLVSAVLAGCNKSGVPAGGDTGILGNDPPTCSTSVDRTAPANGAMDHYYRDPIVFELSEPDSTAAFVTDIVGSTSVSEDGLILTFIPEGVLSPSTEYTVGLNYCYGEPEITFTTSHYGATLAPSVELEGRTYALNLNSGDYTIGDDVGELFSAVFTRDILFQLRDVDGTNLEVLAAISASGASPVEQDMCARTIEMDDVDIGGLPYFSGGVSGFEFGALDGLLRFSQFDFYGTIASDGESIGGMRYLATMGVEEIASLLPDFGGVDELCVLADNLGVPCEPCPDDEASSCMTIAAEHIHAQQVDVDLEVITDRLHPDCDSE